MLDRQLQQRTQASDDLLERRVRTQPPGIDLEPATEVDELIHRHGTTLTGHQVDHLWHRTEGWPAGLCLAARRVRSRPDTVQAIDEVRGQEPAIFDYLIN